MGIGIESEEDAEHHADPEGYVTEFGGGLYGVAEKAPHLVLPLGRHQNADPISEFEGQIGRRYQVGIVPSHEQMGRKASGKREFAERHPNQIGFPDEDPYVVKVGAVFDNPAWLQASQTVSCLCNSIFALRDHQQAISRRHHKIVGRNEILSAFTNHCDLDPAGQVGPW